MRGGSYNKPLYAHPTAATSTKRGGRGEWIGGRGWVARGCGGGGGGVGGANSGNKHAHPISAHIAQIELDRLGWVLITLASVAEAINWRRSGVCLYKTAE